MLRILRPGVLTTVQDLGRYGHQHEGIPVSGAMDAWALRVANLLVGNTESDAALEITLAGFSVIFEESALIALTGAELGATLDDTPAPSWRPISVRSGATLTVHGAATGCRAYLAVAGGIAVPVVLGSRSTFVRAALGGYMGRALRRDDVLSCGAPSPLATRIADALRRDDESTRIAQWGAGSSLRPPYSAAPVVRLIDGTHTDRLTPTSRDMLYAAEFRIAAQSDRMGYRLEGPALELEAPMELLSEGVAFGTVQLPPGGAPIILMADRQTTGGYPRIGEVASIDHSLVAQLRPGDRVRFRRLSLDEAQALYLAREQKMMEARRAISLLYS